MGTNFVKTEITKMDYLYTVYMFVKFIHFSAFLS